MPFLRACAVCNRLPRLLAATECAIIEHSSHYHMYSFVEFNVLYYIVHWASYNVSFGEVGLHSAPNSHIFRCHQSSAMLTQTLHSTESNHFASNAQKDSILSRALRNASNKWKTQHTKFRTFSTLALTVNKQQLTFVIVLRSTQNKWMNEMNEWMSKKKTNFFRQQICLGKLIFKLNELKI